MFIINNQPLGLYWLLVGLLTAASLLTNRSQWYLRLPVAFLGFFAGVLLLLGIRGGIGAIFVAFVGIVMGSIEIIHAFRGAGRGLGILGLTSIFLGLTIALGSLGAASQIFTLAIGVITIILGIASVRTAMRSRPDPS